MRLTKWKMLGIVWIVFGTLFFVWILASMNADRIDEVIFQSNSKIQVTQTSGMVMFTPTKPDNKVVVFYPGALVDPNAYAPLCRKIAENRYQTMICKMPWRLATKGYQKIKEMSILNDPSKQYILIGHSLGGKMAAQFVYENPDAIHQLVLLGTSHPRDINLSGSLIPMMKIYGSNDSVADLEKVEKNKTKLPSSTQYILIDGANHSQFGYYGFQFGDSEVTITREEQQKQVLESVLAFISSSQG